MNRDLRRGWMALVQQIEPEVELMLGAGLPTTPEIVNRDLTHFFNRVRSRQYGRRWADTVLEKPIVAVGFHEMLEGNHHVHLAVSGPERFYDRIATDGSRIWKSTRIAGDFHVDSIKRIEAYSNYITKAVNTPRSLDSVFLYRSRDLL